jgi:hypothetical protein
MATNVVISPGTITKFPEGRQNLAQGFHPWGRNTTLLKELNFLQSLLSPGRDERAPIIEGLFR